MATEIESPDELAAYLNHACGGDESLRQRVQALLNARGAANKKLSSR